MDGIENKEESIQSESIDELSSVEDYRDIQKRLWIEIAKTAAFAMAALAVIVIGSIAWFMANSQVHSASSSVSAQKGNFKIASKGFRQEAEKNRLRLDEGTTSIYADDTYYLTEGGEIALRLSEQYSVFPGSNGYIDFYIIPSEDGEINATIYLGLTGYIEDESTTEEDVKRCNDSVLDSLLSGHILLFGKKYENGYYSDWLNNNNGEVVGIFNNSITVQVKDAEKNIPHRVRIYWIWPLRYENMMGDLYEENSQEFTNRFSFFVEEQSKKNNMKQISEQLTNYLYSRIFLTKDFKSESLSNSDLRSKAYNLADEYIGTNAQYLYLTIKTAPIED